MSGTAAAAEGAAAAPAVSGGRPRRVVLLLAVLIAASGLLRLWYLPSVERSRAEAAAVQSIEAVLSGSSAPDYRAAPAGWVPQLLLLRLADRLHQATDLARLHVATKKGRLTRRGLHLARQLSVLYGMAGILLLFLLARRLHSAELGLTAAVVLAFSPWHILASVTLAPEALVLALSALSLWLALRALDSPSVARLALVGAALGVAAAVKPTGALVAVPVLLGLVLGGRRGPRRLLALAVTLPLALAVWWALSAPLDLYAAALALERAQQVRRAVPEQSSRFTVAVLGLLLPLFASVHGRLLGGLALLGAAGQAFRCLFLVDPGPARAHRLMVLAGAPLFVLGYAWATPLFRESSFVPLLVYSSLYAAVMLGSLWEGLAALLPRVGLAPAGLAASALAAALALLLVVPAGWRFVYSARVGSTLESALEWLRDGLERDGPRVVLVEQEALEGGAESAMRLADGLALQLVPRLAAVEETRLERADGAIFLRRELEAADGALYHRRRQGAPRSEVVEARLLRRQGPALVALLHPRGSGAPAEFALPLTPDGNGLAATLNGAAAAAAGVSLALRLPPAWQEAPAPPRAWLDGVELDLAAGGLFPRTSIFVTERLPVSAAPRRLRVELPPWAGDRWAEVTAAAYLWP